MQPGRLLVVLGLAAAFACAEGFSPGARVNLAIVPVFTDAAPGVLTGDLDQLRVRVTRVPSGSLVIDTTVAVDTAGNVDLPLTVPLLADPESFEILIQGVRSSDAAVLYDGTDTVQVAAGSTTPPPVQIAVAYVGPCQPTSGCQVTVGPAGATLAQGDSVQMTLAVDSAGIAKLGVPVSLLNLDSALVRVRSSRYVVARTGTAGGQARIVGQIRGDEDTLVVTILSQGSPAIGLSTTTINFAATAGGANPTAQTVNVSNTSAGTLTGLGVGTIVYGSGASGWLAASFNQTTAPATLTLTATTGSLLSGTYTATVPVTSGVASNSPQNVSVTFTVAAAPAITLNPTTITFSATQGGTSPSAQTVSVTNGGGGSLSGLSASIAYGSGSGWLAASLNQTTAPATLTLTPTLGSLTANTYTATVTVSSTVPGVTSQTVGVSFVVNPGAPAVVIVTPGYAAIRTTAPNQTIQLADTVKDSFGNVLSPSLATWTSRSSGVASVSTSGLVTGLTRGSAVIVATAGGASDSTVVTVGDATSAPGDMLVAAVTNQRAFGSRRVGQAVTVDIRVDQLATADSLGSYNARYSWNPAVLRFDSTSAGNYAAPTVNDSSSIGVLRFAAVDANSKSGALVLTRLWFTALTTGDDAHVLQISEMSGVSPNFYNYFANGRLVIVSGNARITP